MFSKHQTPKPFSETTLMHYNKNNEDLSKIRHLCSNTVILLFHSTYNANLMKKETFIQLIKRINN